MGEPGWRNIILIVPTVWLFFPIGVLSSLSSVSRWMFLRPRVVWNMLRLFPSTLVFYLLSGLVVLVGALPWCLAVLGNAHALLIPAAPLSAACVLIYARLLGLLARKVQRLTPILAVKAETHWPPPRKTRKRSHGHDLWALPQDVPEPPPEPRGRSHVIVFEEDGDVTEPYAVVEYSEPPQSAPEDVPASTRPLDAEDEDARKGFGIATDDAHDRFTSDRETTPSPPRGPQSVARLASISSVLWRARLSLVWNQCDRLVCAIAGQYAGGGIDDRHRALFSWIGIIDSHAAAPQSSS